MHHAHARSRPAGRAARHGRGRPARRAGRAARPAPRAAAAAQLRVVGEHACAGPASTCSPAPIASSSAARHSASSLPPVGATPIRSDVRAELDASRDASPRSAPAAGRTARPRTARAPGLASSPPPPPPRGCRSGSPRGRSWRWWSANRPSVKIASRSAHAGSTPEPGSVRRRPRRRPRSRARVNGCVGDQQVPVEVDVVGERRDLRGRRDAQLGLDHAPEHHLQPQRARGVDHAQRLADAAALGELDVDRRRRSRRSRATSRRSWQPSSITTGGARLQLAQGAEAVEVGGRERLLDELDAQLDQLRHQLARGLERPALVAVDAQRRRRVLARTARSRSRSSGPPTLIFSTS